jgi:uncharacterized protein (TIGR00251 family)
MDVHDVSRIVKDGVEVRIMVTPNSDERGSNGMNEWRRCLVIRVRSPPMGGKANREIEELMENITGCRSEVIKGHTGRQKTVMIYGSHDEILRTLVVSG